MSFGTFLKLAAAFSFIATSSAWAQENKDQPIGVIELFTSQGCSTCPPADSLFEELAAKDNLVALAYHVDYWNYLGWRDTLSTPASTTRQYDYMRSFDSRSVYTPQAVLNGRKHVNGADRIAINTSIDEMQREGKGLSVSVKVSKTKDTITIETGAATGKEKQAQLVLVYFNPPQPITVDRGENKGKTLTYWNAVSDVQAAGMWYGKAARFDLPAREIAKKGGCAVLLQATDENGLPGAILGAAMVRKPSI